MNENKIIKYTIDVEAAKSKQEISDLKSAVKKLTKAYEKSDKRLTESKAIKDKLITTENKLRLAQEKARVTKNQNTSAHKNSTLAINREIQRLTELNKTLDFNGAAYKKNLVQITALSNKMNKSSAASGSAAASVMELSRVVSDAPYGIRGVANNLTQLAGNLVHATAAAGGLGKALKQMGKMFLGPLGLLFLFTSVIAYMDHMSTKTKELEKDSKRLSGIFGEEATKLMVLKTALNNSNIALKDKTELVNLAKEEFEDLNIELDETGRLSTESANAIDALSLSFIKNAKARAIVELIQKEMSKQLEVEAQDLHDNLSTWEAFTFGVTKAIVGVEYASTAAINKASANQKESLDKSQRTIDKYVAMLTDKNGELAKLIWDPNKKDLGDKEPKKLNNQQEFSSNRTDLDEYRQKQRDKEMLAVIKHEEDRLAFQQEIEQRELLMMKDALNLREHKRHEAYVKRQELRIENANGDEAIIKAANDLIFNADAEHHRNLLNTEDEYQSAKKVLTETQETETDMFLLARAEKEVAHSQKMRDIKLEEEAWIKENGITRRVWTEEQEILNMEKDLEVQKAKLDAFKVGTEERLLAEEEYAEASLAITIAKNKKEQTIEKAKADFQNKLFDATASSFGSLSSLMKKNSKEAKTFALLEIAAKTAQGIINGLRIAQEGSTGPGGPYMFPAFFATQTAAVLGAAARAKSILKGGATGGGGSAEQVAAPTFSPNFNVVGNSGQNQLAQGIGNQINQPVQAYVVYDDIANAGEVTNNSIETAGLG